MYGLSAFLLFLALASWQWMDAWLISKLIKLPSFYSIISSYLTYLITPPLHLVLWPTLALIAYLKKSNNHQKLIFYALSASVLATNLCVRLAKWLIPRQRPGLGNDEIHFMFGNFSSSLQSFPSGHAATIFSVLILLGYYYPKYRWTFFLLAFFASLTRAVLIKHYLSDVLAGAALGTLVASIIFSFYQKYVTQRNPHAR